MNVGTNPQNPAKIKVLIVDDHPILREGLSTLINGQSDLMVCGESENGQEALDKLKLAQETGSPYQFIICDWNMPVMTGLELLEKRKDDPELTNIPFLMVTIESELSYVMKAVSMGINDFIVKPFSQKTIENKISRIYSKLNV